jgi:tetratricopeptide (TPR) repeat protein
MTPSSAHQPPLTQD